MKPTTKWTSEKEQYIIDNYRILLTETIAAHLKTTQNIVRCRAAYLRKNGKPVAEHPIFCWKKNIRNKETLMNLYGTRPTHQIAKILNTKVRAIHQAASEISIRFQGNSGCYTFSELGQILKIDEKTIKCWTNFGLKIRGFAKDGRTHPRTSKSKRAAMRKFNALIDLSDLKKFLELRPEAYNLGKLDAETIHLLELTGLEQQCKEKKMQCKKCAFHIWTELYNSNMNCPKCGRFLGKWSTGEYRN